MKINSNLDINNNQIIKVRIESVSELPTDNLVEGRIVYYTVDKKYYYYDGEKWCNISQIDTFPGYSYNGNEDDASKQITKWAISTESEVASNQKASDELANSNKPVTAKQVASTLKNIPWFLNPTSIDSNSDHFGYLICDKNGKLSFLDTSIAANTYKNIDITKNKDMIPKIKAGDGDVTVYPFLIDNAWSQITPAESWSDVIPTSGCVINAIKNMAGWGLINPTISSKELVVIDETNPNNYLTSTFDVTTNIENVDNSLFDASDDTTGNNDEIVLTTTANGIQSTRKLVNIPRLKFIDNFGAYIQNEININDCIPTMDVVTQKDVFTCVISTSDELMDWLTDSSTSNAKYASVLIKAGEYTIDTTRNIQPLKNTHKISSSGEVIIHCNNSDEHDITKIFYAEDNINKICDIQIENLNLKLSTPCKNVCVFENIHSISNSTFTIDVDDATSDGNIVIFKSCNNITNCYLDINCTIGSQQYENHIFQYCNNISNNEIIFNMTYMNSNSNWSNTNPLANMDIMNTCNNISNIYFKKININMNPDSTTRIPQSLSIMRYCNNISKINIGFLNTIDFGQYVTSTPGDYNSMYIEDSTISLFNECTNLRDIIGSSVNSCITMIGKLNVNFAIFHRCRKIYSCILDYMLSFTANDSGVTENNSNKLHGMLNCENVHYCENFGDESMKFSDCAGVEHCSAIMNRCYSDINYDKYREMDSVIQGCSVPASDTSDGGRNHLII